MNYVCLRGKEILNIARMQDYSEWAMGLLGDGVESTSVAVLAGFAFEKNPYPDDIHDYFQRSLEELNLTVPLEEESLKAYARFLCEGVINGDAPPKESLDELNEICMYMDYESAYYEFFILHNDMENLFRYPGGYLLHEGITKENFDSYVIAEARNFLKESGE